MTDMKIGYARVSTLDQNPELQLAALREVGCERIFTETASGARQDRRRLRAAMRSIKPGDTLVVWKFDRLARSLRQLTDTLEVLDKRGAGFQSLTEVIDTTTPGGRLIFHIMAALAEFERALIRERTLAGLATARAEGRVGGRPRKLSEDVLRQAREARAADSASIPELAKALGVSTSTLYRRI